MSARFEGDEVCLNISKRGIILFSFLCFFLIKKFYNNAIFTFKFLNLFNVS